MKRPTCNSCIHWDKSIFETDYRGLCRQHAPRHIVELCEDNDLYETADFTVTKKDDWCSRHQDFKKYIRQSMNGSKCETCFYWHQFENEKKSGECRRRAPKYLPGFESELDNAFVDSDYWCGEHSDHE